MSNLDNALLRITLTLAVAVEQHLFVEADGTLPAADGHALGVTETEGSSGAAVAVAVIGVVAVTAGEALSAGDPLKVTAAGTVVANVNAKVTVARALEDASASGDQIRCLLIAN